ncbi:MAG: hypothetical protein GY847_28735 [Proteobacteria bacterium]|nr:hypothetical protein [Pseudomonadota bacterium]
MTDLLYYRELVDRCTDQITAIAALDKIPGLDADFVILALANQRTYYRSLATEAGKSQFIQDRGLRDGNPAK